MSTPDLAAFLKGTFLCILYFAEERLCGACLAALDALQVPFETCNKRLAQGREGRGLATTRELSCTSRVFFSFCTWSNAEIRFPSSTDRFIKLGCQDPRAFCWPLGDRSSRVGVYANSGMSGEPCLLPLSTQAPARAAKCLLQPTVD